MNTTQTHWVLWAGGIDENEGEWVEVPYAVCPRKGISRETAAAYLLLAGWEAEQRPDENDLEPFHEVRQTGLLSSEQLYAVADLAWPETPA